MIQLAFEPAFDPFHSAFRLLRQLEYGGAKQVFLPRLKVLDVFVAEPRRCLDIRLQGEQKKAARLAAKCQKPTYGHRPSKQALFNRMSPMQDAALQTLVSQGFLDQHAFENKFAQRTTIPLPEPLHDRVTTKNDVEHPLMEFVIQALDTIPFEGAGGLKDRTGLGEYRYDIV
ncbi:MAG: hypothetical protein IPM67_10705 [Sphingomonadales bacterium]|jgi:hypothetical protein|nr:hypothetical protein [Sphingomonadales bacterium]MBK9269092.1 hypothetical protein [Sphingomonadales bacterium]